MSERTLPATVPDTGQTDSFLNGLLDLAWEAASAGAAVLAGREGSGTPHSLHATNKSADGDWVTDFDTQAELAVREVLTRIRPQDTITGEEYGTSQPAGGAAPRIRWSIDPLDGTTNFIRDIVYYATSVAAADEDGRWLVGVVHAPALERIYWASRGGGAWVAERGRVRRMRGPVERPGQLLGTGFSYDPATRAEQFQALPGPASGFADIRRLGSAALDLCLVADGSLDAYMERGLNEYDWAAGALIAEEAGAWVHRPVLQPGDDGAAAEAARLAAVVAAGGRGTAQRLGLTNSGGAVGGSDGG